MIPVHVKLLIAAVIAAAIFYSGMRWERTGWLEAAAKQGRQDRQKEQASTRTSEAVADGAREKARDATNTTKAAEAAAIESIRYVYLGAKPVCPDAPGLPDGVRRALQEADAALAAAR